MPVHDNDSQYLVMLHGNQSTHSTSRKERERGGKPGTFDDDGCR